MADETIPPSGPVAVLASLPRPVPPPDLEPESEWPGVEDPDALRALVAQWLAGYGGAQTRRTYAYALGLPIAWADGVTGRPDTAAGGGTTQGGTTQGGTTGPRADTSVSGSPEPAGSSGAGTGRS
ncbi:MAG: hypothetical protein ABW212_07075, partial [Pseudonocardia sediminis]